MYQEDFSEKWLALMTKRKTCCKHLKTEISQQSWPLNQLVKVDYTSWRYLEYFQSYYAHLNLTMTVLSRCWNLLYWFRVCGHEYLKEIISEDWQLTVEFRWLWAQDWMMTKLAVKNLEEAQLVSCIILACAGRRREGYGNVEIVNHPRQETHNLGLSYIRTGLAVVAAVRRYWQAWLDWSALILFWLNGANKQNYFSFCLSPTMWSEGLIAVNNRAE